MGERLHESTEKVVERIDVSNESRKHLEKLKEEAEKAPEANAEQARHKVEDEAISGKEITVGERQSSPQMTIDRKAKSQSYRKTLRKVQTNLSKPERTLSKLIHQPVIEKASSFGAATIARPSGFLAGSLATLLGSAFLLIAAKRYGFNYNYLVFVILFVAGYILGIAVESLLRVTRLSKK